MVELRPPSGFWQRKTAPATKDDLTFWDDCETWLELQLRDWLLQRICEPLQLRMALQVPGEQVESKVTRLPSR